MKISEASLLRLWIWGSVAAFVGFCVWVFVPILIPFGVVVAALALLTYGVQRVAARYQKHPPPE